MTKNPLSASLVMARPAEGMWGTWWGRGSCRWQISWDVNIILETFMDRAVWQAALFMFSLCSEQRSHMWLACSTTSYILMTLKYHIFLPILLETKRLYMHQRHLLVCGDIFIIPARALLFIYVQWTFFSWKMVQSCHGIIAGISERWQILSAHVPPELCCSAKIVVCL